MAENKNESKKARALPKVNSPAKRKAKEPKDLTEELDAIGEETVTALRRSIPKESSNSFQSILGIPTQPNKDVMAGVANIRERLLENLSNSLPTSFNFESINLNTLLGTNSKTDAATAASFATVRNKLISSISTQLPKRFSFDKTIDLENLLGENEMDQKSTAKGFGALKNKLLDAIRANLPKKFAFAEDGLDIAELLGENENDSYATLYHFATMKMGLINTIKRSLKGVTFNFGDDIDVAKLLGENENDQYLTAWSFSRLKRKLVKSISAKLPTEFDFGSDIDIPTLLGSNDKDNFFTAFSFWKLRTDLISKMRAALPDTFNWSKDISIGDLFGESAKDGLLATVQLAAIRHKIFSLIKKSFNDGQAEPTASPSDEAIVSSAGSIDTQPVKADTPIAPLIEQSNAHLTDIGYFLIELVDFFKGNEETNQENAAKQSRTFESMARSLENTSGNVAPIESSKNDKSKGVFSLKGFGEGLSSIGKGLATLGKGIGKGLGGIIEGVFTGIGRGLKVLSDPKLFIGVGVLVALSGAIWLSAKAFKQFTDISWGDVAIGVGILALMAAGLAAISSIAAPMLIGSAALLVTAAAIGVAGLAFQQFGGIDWKAVGIGLAVLGGVALVAALIAPAAPLMLIGAAAIGVLGLAMIPAAAAFNLFSKAMIPFGKALTIIGGGIVLVLDGMATAFGAVLDAITGSFDAVVNTLLKLNDIDAANLGAAALGILSLSAALVTFAGASFITGIVSFFSADPFANFYKIAERSEGLTKAAAGIKELRNALDVFSGGDSKSLLDFFSKDTAKSIGIFISAMTKSIDLSALNMTTVAVDTLVSSLENLRGVYSQFENMTVKNVEGRINTPAPVLDAATIQNKTAQTELTAAASKVSIGPSILNQTQNSNSSSNVTFNESNHIDATMMSAVLMNRF